MSSGMYVLARLHHHLFERMLLARKCAVEVRGIGGGVGWHVHWGQRGVARWPTCSLINHQPVFFPPIDLLTHQITNSHDSPT